MSEYGCNDLVPHSNMVFINGGLTTNALNYEIDGIKPEYTLTFRIIVRSIKSGWSAIIRKGKFCNLTVIFGIRIYLSEILRHRSGASSWSMHMAYTRWYKIVSSYFNYQ